MKVMWVVGRMPSPVAASLGGGSASGGGWQDALIAALAAEPSVRLLVAHPGPERGRSRTVDGVEYRDIGELEPSGSVERIARRWFPGGPDPACVRECAAIARDWEPDLVHFHGTESGLGLAAASLRGPWALSIQGVRTVMEEVELALDGPLRRGPAVGPGEFLRGLSKWHEWRRLRASAAVEREILRGCRNVLGRTAFDRRVAAILSPDARYFHVGEMLRPGFSGASWQPRADYGRDTVRLLAIASKFEMKGLHAALEAVRLLAEGGTDVRLDVVGFGARSLPGRKLASHAARTGVSGRVSVLGEMGADEVLAAFLASDAYLHPSLADNSPNAVCEAMMLGVPCVAASAGGVPSLISDGEDGLLVPPGDAYSLAGAVRALLAEDREAVLRLSATARVRARERHDPDTVLSQLLTAYDQIVNGQAAPLLAAPAAR